MAKSFTFQTYPATRAYGSRQGPSEVLIVNGASDKAAAKAVAEKNRPSARIFAGRSHDSEAAAANEASNSAKLWAVPCITIDIGMQKGIANLLGM